MQHITLRDTGDGSSPVGSLRDWTYRCGADGTEFAHRSGEYSICREDFKPGGRVWFYAKGADSQCGAEKRPKSPFRRAFYDAGYPAYAKLFHFNVSEDELRRIYETSADTVLQLYDKRIVVEMGPAKGGGWNCEVYAAAGYGDRERGEQTVIRVRREITRQEGE